VIFFWSVADTCLFLVELSKSVKYETYLLGDTSTNPISSDEDVKQNEISSAISQLSERKKSSRHSAVAIIMNSNVCPFRFNRLFNCMYCDTQFVGMSELVQHTTSEHQNVTERDVTMAVAALSKNNPIKINITDILCKICNNELSDFNDLKHHLVGKHKIEVDLENDGVMTYSVTENEYKCVTCGSKFDNYRVLNKHVTDKHYNTYVCDQCGDGFASRAGLRIHSYSHSTGSHHCEVCGKAYNSIMSKRQHMKIVHLHVKLNKCTYCSETFRGYYQKLKHIMTVHGKKKYDYKCGFCPKTFLTNSNLRKHERVVHTQGEVYTCETCNYHTYTPQLLKRHMICHSDEKNFKCEVCGKRYARKRTLVEHMKIHNNVRRFVCKYCDKAFVQNCSLKGHMKTHHRDVESTDC
jgi:uncharacterized Zn-finger protein